MFRRSNFRPVSIGIVAANKPRGTKLISVTPIEILSDVQDDIRTDLDTVSTTGIDNNENLIKISITRGIAIEAEWIGENYMHLSPDVRRGEQVQIYQSGNSDKYYWGSMGRDLNLRRLETVAWAINANPSNDDAEMSRENSYVYEISSHDKHVTFSTSNKNGEASTYISQYNLAEGIYSLEDNHGNFWYLDSVEKDFHFKNGNGSYFRMNKHTFECYAKDSIDFRTNKFTVDCKEYLEKSGNSTVKTGAFKRNAASNNITGPTTMQAVSATGMVVSGATTMQGITATNIKVDYIEWAAAKGPAH